MHRFLGVRTHTELHAKNQLPNCILVNPKRWLKGYGGRRRRKCFQRPIHIYIINIAQAHGIRKWPNYYFGSGLKMYMVLVFLIVKNDNTTQVLAWTGFANYPLFTYTLPCQGAVGET